MRPVLTRAGFEAKIQVLVGELGTRYEVLREFFEKRVDITN